MNQDHLIEQSKHDLKVWEESDIGKQYALIRNRVLMENNCSELGFDEIQRLIEAKVKEMDMAPLSFSEEGRTVGSINNREGDLK